jgi:hypothetical protein
MFSGGFAAGKSQVTLLSGPEGGFSEQERQLCQGCRVYPGQNGCPDITHRNSSAIGLDGSTNPVGRFSLRVAMALLAPLGVLVVLAGLASVLSFGFLQLAGDVLPLAKLLSKVTLGCC